MSIQMVEVISEQETTVQFLLNDPSRGYFVKEIEGLDPVKAEIVSSSFGTVDGTQYQSAKRGNRNIILHLGFAPDYSTMTVESLRTSLYQKIMPQSQVRLKFYLRNGKVVEILGRVESFDAALFSKDPAADISIINFDPDFYELAPTVYEGNTSSNLSNEFVIDYEGNIASGFIFKMDLPRAISGFEIYHRGANNVASSIEVAYPYLQNDSVELNTNSGQKGLWVIKSGQKISALPGFSLQSTWIQLRGGSNYMKVIVDGAAIPFTMSYYNKYGAL